MVRSAAEVDGIARMAVAMLAQRIPVAEAWLFGSHVTGDATEDSDIDIVAFSPAVDEWGFGERVALAIDIEKGVDAPLDLHLFGEVALREARPTNFYGFVRAHGRRIT